MEDVGSESDQGGGKDVDSGSETPSDGEDTSQEASDSQQTSPHGRVPLPGVCAVAVTECLTYLDECTEHDAHIVPWLYREDPEPQHSAALAGFLAQGR